MYEQRRKALKSNELNLRDLHGIKALRKRAKNTNMVLVSNKPHMRCTVRQLFNVDIKAHQAPNVDLYQEEKKDGSHTLERHLITAWQARQRLVEDPSVANASFWPDVETANEVVNKIIKEKWHAIKAWATSVTENTRLELSIDNNQGFVVMRGDEKVHRANKAIMYLKKPHNNKATWNEVTLITCFPFLEGEPKDEGKGIVTHNQHVRDWKNKKLLIEK